MKRFIMITLTVIACFLLQTTVLESLKLAGVMPNLMLILVVSFAFMRGRSEGLVIGFFCGLLIDILYGSFLGLYAFIYMLMGYINGYFNKLFYVDDIMLPMIIITINDIFYNLLIYVFFFVFRNRLDFLYYLRKIIVPEVVYTILVTLVVYRIFLWINTKLETSEKRRQI